jgi:hypothetical protein
LRAQHEFNPLSIPADSARAMPLLSSLGMYARLAVSLPALLRQHDTPEKGIALLAERQRRRGESLLRLFETAVYAYPRSPYLPLLRAAGVELGDLRRMVPELGVEATLERLRAAGVAVPFEAFKGRAPLVVGGREIALGPDDFASPLSAPHLVGLSSGSTGARVRQPVSFEHKAAERAVRLAVRQLQGVLGPPRAVIVGTLPESSRFGGALDGGGPGNVPERWFTPVLTPPRRPEPRFRLAHRFVVAVARLHGVRIPPPEPLPVGEVGRVARWAADAVSRRGAAIVQATPSMALRIAIAAERDGIDLAGVTFTTGGEPMTEAKRERIRASGAEVLCSYHMKEAGMIGAACLRPHGPNDQHVMTPHVALVQGRREVLGQTVDALLVTQLLPTSPRVLINVETDDFGVLEERRCGCPLDEIGLHLHVRDVRSYKKLTAEGVTLVGSDLERVLERELPERFGGSPLDYQLVEEEDGDGFTRICLRISPSVAIADEAEVVAALRDGLRRASISADLACRLWSQAGAIRVARVEPPMSVRGKLFPIQSTRREAESRRVAGGR